MKKCRVMGGEVKIHENESRTNVFEISIQRKNKEKYACFQSSGNQEVRAQKMFWLFDMLHTIDCIYLSHSG
jgi:hypothetical protein